MNTTPSNSALDAVEDHQFSDTINKIFSKKLPTILTGKDAKLNKVRDCKKTERRSQKKDNKSLYSLIRASYECKTRLHLSR